jgi:predicted nucleic acid-binding Zn ribbon protein
MGRCFEFKCSNPSCGYEATVSGGKDFGFCGEVEAMVCLDCKEMMDVLTAAAPDLKPVERKCDECGGKNLKVFHSGKTRCPKCGARLKKSEDFNLWD